MAAGPELVYDILASVRYHLVMKRRHHTFLVVLVVLAAVMGEDTRNTDTNSTQVKDVITPTNRASNITTTTMAVMKKSPRVFVNTSIPFSVAPQPVKDTLEVALARRHFMNTFNRIQDAVIAADTEHLNYTPLEDNLTNKLDDQTERSTTEKTTTVPTTQTTTVPTTQTTTVPTTQARTSFSQRGPAPIIGTTAQPAFSIFPDPIFEPEYFLPSVHVDPVLMGQLDPPLPHDPYIQQIRPISDPGMAGTCYEIILLESEQDFFQIAQSNVSMSKGGVTFPSHGSLLDAIAPPIQGRTRSKPKPSPGVQLIPVGTPAVPSVRANKPVTQFREMQQSFLSLLQAGALSGTGR